MGKKKSKIAFKISLILLEIVFFICIGFTIAVLKDKDVYNGDYILGSIQISANKEGWFESEQNSILKIKPGDSLFKNDINFNMNNNFNNESFYVRAKYDVSADGLSGEAAKIYNYLKYKDLKLGSDNDYSWSKKIGDYYYLMNAEGTDPLIVSSKRGTDYSFLKAQENIVSNELNYNPSLILNSDIKINISIEAVQSANIELAGEDSIIKNIEKVLNEINNVNVPNENHTVEFINSNGASLGQINVANGQSADISNIVSSALQDAGFSLWEEGLPVIKSGGKGHTYISDGKICNVTEDLVLYVPKLEQSYLVNFYNGTTLLQSSKVKAGESAQYIGVTPIKIDETGKTFFVFSGWDKPLSNINSDLNVYAQFNSSKNVVYNITYYLNDGAFISDNIKYTYTYVDTINLPTVSDVYKVGFIFVGWYENPEFTGNAITTIPAEQVGDKIYYAKWQNALVGVQLGAGRPTYFQDTIDGSGKVAKTALDKAFDAVEASTVAGEYTITLFDDCELTKSINISSGSGKIINIVNGNSSRQVTLTNNGHIKVYEHTLNFGGKSALENNFKVISNGQTGGDLQNQSLVYADQGSLLNIYGGTYDGLAPIIVLNNGGMCNIVNMSVVQNNNSIIDISSGSSAKIKNINILENESGKFNLINLNDGTLYLDSSSKNIPSIHINHNEASIIVSGQIQDNIDLYFEENGNNIVSDGKTLVTFDSAEDAEINLNNFSLSGVLCSLNTSNNQIVISTTYIIGDEIYTYLPGYGLAIDFPLEWL